jgi:hypothetical protein
MKLLTLKTRVSLSIAALSVLISTSTRSAMALPSYARQTGLPCNACHYTPPELNPAGRLFKLLAYTQRTDNSTVPAPTSDKRRPGLQMLQVLPLGAWLETSFTSTRKAQPSTQNGSFEFPQDISLFLAGAWANHLGSFLQVTYNAQDDHFSMDNTDIRFAEKVKVNGKDLIYGLMFNNNPTVEDVWMTLPNWGYPFIATDSAPTPAASAILQGSLAQDVAGFGGYTMWNNHLYAAATVYRSDHIGSPQPNPGNGASYNISGVAPYWRLAWQETGRTNFLEAGFYGMHMASFPGGSTSTALSGPTDDYTDFGPDLEYDRTIGRDVLSLRGTYLRENSTLNASSAAGSASPGNHHLNTGNANIEYHYGNRVSGAFGWFITSGTADSVLYAPAAITGSANGSPKSTGYIANFSYWPTQNVDLAFQYTGYTRFNGGSTNYDGSGRNATDNNAAYLLARFVF